MMAALKGDTATTAQIWGTEKTFAQRASEAVPDSLLRDIVADASKSREPRSLMTPTASSGLRPLAPPAPVPTFAEWCHQRLGVDWTEDRAKAYYETKRWAGEDVGPVRPHSHSLTPAVAPAVGWVEPTPIGPPPGIDILDKMMDHADRLDRAERAKNGGRW
jgi:hypothetical protein